MKFAKGKHNRQDQETGCKYSRDVSKYLCVYVCVCEPSFIHKRVCNLITLASESKFVTCTQFLVECSLFVHPKV